MKIISSKKWNEQQTQIENLMSESVSSYKTISVLNETITEYKNEVYELKEEITHLKSELENHPKRDISTGKFTKRK